MKSIAYQAGEKAALSGILLQNSAITKLSPNSSRYDDFLSGFNSINHDELDCGCDSLGSQCCVCDDD
ncbi:hypothetical protein ACTFQF_00700 [Aliivibrio fischeri]|uniref:Uncharacterized protein n=1 Tax=Aliivibrio fischeri (strain MJ11) TaxID=388396 RepID=B5EWA5_ALIFM|nr:hypothetical protein [Aliivibrio fischeri]ACH64790.1 hypothetical protein VFMJ11_B0162 [Aliivibrio fischeri MJ11]MUK37573.1 hypothetical protein [Aliivibrio fischeri]